jgi:long-chain fatty acid transport protein
MTRSPPCLSDRWILIMALVFLIISPTNALPGAPVHGAKAAAMGTAFVAVADDPSAITHNPAGITLLKGTNLYNGQTVFILSSSYKNPEGQSETTQPQVFLPPTFYLTSDFGTDNLAFGLGVYSLYGIGGRKWSQTGLTRYVSTDSLIGTLHINPTVAWRVLPQVSVGIGLDVLYAVNRMVNMVDQSFFGAPDAKLRFKGDGFGVGYNLGILLFPGKKFSFAFAYRSEIRVRQRGGLELESIAPPLQSLFGGDSFSTGASIVTRFPHIFSWGMAFRPNPKWTIALDVEWLRWSSFNRLSLALDQKVPAAGLSDITMNLNWGDSVLVKAGVDYRWRDNVSLRAGYSYLSTPVPDYTLSPANPDAEAHYLSLGMGYTWRRWVFDGFYGISLYPSRTVNNPILSGTYQNTGHYFGLSVGYRFNAPRNDRETGRLTLANKASP